MRQINRKTFHYDNMMMYYEWELDNYILRYEWPMGVLT